MGGARLYRISPAPRFFPAIVRPGRLRRYIYMGFGVGLLFYDARGRKEGVDLRSEIDEVFGGPPPPELPLA